MNENNSYVDTVANILQDIEVPSDSSCITILNCSKSQCEKSDNVEKATAVWTYDATLTLLKLYENKLEMLETPKKKTRIWNAISESLKEYNIEMSPDQVRWKINALTKKYKLCVDTCQHAKFKYFKEMDNIYAQYNVDCDMCNDGDIIHRRKDCKQSIQNARIYRESKSMIELRKARLARRLEADRMQSKLNIEKQWLEYLNRQEQNKIIQDVMFERNLKLKEEELDIQRQELEIKESIELRKLQLKEQEYKSLSLFEKEKCDILRQAFENRII